MQALLILSVSCGLLLLTLGIIERRQHQARLNSIPVRILVNGIRGKSTVTRLITAVLAEAGYRVVGKCTGTKPRIIYWYTDQEEEIIRRPEGANIREQKMVTAKAFEAGADAMVMECMAVRPDYQIVYQEKLVQANIVVITNILEDHMEIMGPTLDNVAQAFAGTVPYNGDLVLVDVPYAEYFGKICDERGTRLHLVDCQGIDPADLGRFPYIAFPDNIDIALTVARVLQIEDEVAWRGMLKAQPDPGVATIIPICSADRPGFFLNGFAANDVRSTLRLWRLANALGYPVDDPMVIMNCRSDRMPRTIQFAEELFTRMPIKYLVLMGQSTDPVKQVFERGLLPGVELLDLEGWDCHDIYDRIAPLIQFRVVYGVGNIKGAEELISLLELHRV